MAQLFASEAQPWAEKDIGEIASQHGEEQVVNLFRKKREKKWELISNPKSFISKAIVCSFYLENERSNVGDTAHCIPWIVRFDWQTWNFNKVGFVGILIENTLNTITEESDDRPSYSIEKARNSIWAFISDFVLHEKFGIKNEWNLHVTVAKVKPVIMYKFLRILAKAILW